MGPVNHDFNFLSEFCTACGAPLWRVVETPFACGDPMPPRPEPEAEPVRKLTWDDLKRLHPKLYAYVGKAIGE
jgi:hypothetical protein